jgi:hypothetical protein
LVDISPLFGLGGVLIAAMTSEFNDQVTATALADVRGALGISHDSGTDVTATQAQLLQSENDLSDSDTQIATDLVNLYRALGGGWEVADVAYRVDRAPRQKIGTP